MKLRKSALVAGAAALAFGLAACAGGAAPTSSGGNSKSVTFRSWSPVVATTNAMVTAFQTANPGDTINATIFNYPDYLVDLQTRASSNTFPDVVGLQPGALTQQYRSKLEPLQQCAEKTWGSDWQKKFYPIGLTQARLGNPKGDDNYYSLPLLTQTVNMWANTDIFASTGQKIPTTWSELVSTSKAIQSKGKVGLMFPAKDSWERNTLFLQIANNIAPGLVYRAENGTAKWTDPKIVEAFSYFQKLFTDGIAQKGAIGLDAYPDGVNQFEAGKAGMIPLGAWWIQQSDPTKAQNTIAPLSVGMKGYKPFLFPTIPGGAASSQYVGGTDVALGISKDSKNPALACKVLTDFIDGKAAQKLVDTLNDIPAVSGLTPSKFTSAKQQDIWNTFVNDWLPKTQYSRYFASPKIDTSVGDALSAVATGQQTPDQAAAAVQKVQDSLGS
jgi:ABC-type sugar transport system, periplasmic component